MILSTETVTPQMPKQRSRSFNAAGEPQGEAKSGETMKAIYLDRRAGTEALVAGEIPRPKPQAGEVLVKVHATSVMPTELQWFTTFNLPFGEPRPYPIVLSHEVSGVVESVGAKVNGFNVGDEVFGLNDWFINGAQAEFCVVKATGLARKPKSLVHVQAAVVPISASTAWQGFFRKAKLEPGQDISAGALRRGAVAFCANPSIRIPCLEHCIQPRTRAKDQAPARKTAILQYAALGHPIPSAYRTHCTCQVKFLMK